MIVRLKSSDTLVDASSNAGQKALLMNLRFSIMGLKKWGLTRGVLSLSLIPGTWFLVWLTTACSYFQFFDILVSLDRYSISRCCLF